MASKRENDRVKMIARKKNPNDRLRFFPRFLSGEIGRDPESCFVERFIASTVLLVAEDHAAIFQIHFFQEVKRKWNLRQSFIVFCKWNRFALLISSLIYIINFANKTCDVQTVLRYMHGMA